MTDLGIDKEKLASALLHNWDGLHALQLKYTAAQLKDVELNDMFEATYNSVLSEHEFYANKQALCKRYNVEAGERITSYSNISLLSDSDHERLLDIAKEKQLSLGYLNEDGTYKVGYNGSLIRRTAEDELVMFFISLLPQSLQDTLKPAMRNYTSKTKVIELIMRYSDPGGRGVAQ